MAGLTDAGLAAMRARWTWDFNPAANKDITRLLDEVARLRDEREALECSIFAGLMSGVCPYCHPHFDGTRLDRHDDDCPFRDWRERGMDATIADLTEGYKAIKAETAAFFAEYERTHPEMAGALRRRE